ncbi:hypothetical protein TE10_14600 [Raoultella ornithinolytica]|uniref:hypothetical protein n=1 Tax=Raoultella ornithinolytica TaxID=54291 RepID=UPI000598096C|nr:hypothetical protein TE10_14600 [Raoultella ornithinolytica]
MGIHNRHNLLLYLLLILQCIIFSSNAWSETIPADETDVLFVGYDNSSPFFLVTQGIARKGSGDLLNIENPDKLPVEHVREDGSGGAWFTLGGLNLYHIDSKGQTIRSDLTTLPVENPVIEVIASENSATAIQLCGSITKTDATGKIIKKINALDDVGCQKVVTAATSTGENTLWLSLNDGEIFQVNIDTGVKLSSQSQIDADDSPMAITGSENGTVIMQTEKGLLFYAAYHDGSINLQKMPFPRKLDYVANLFTLGSHVIVGFKSGALGITDSSQIKIISNPQNMLSDSTTGTSFYAALINAKNNYAVLANTRGEIFQLYNSIVKKIASVQSPVIDVIRSTDDGAWIICQDQVYKVFRENIFEVPDLSDSSNPVVRLFEDSHGLWAAHFYGGASFYSEPAPELVATLNSRKISNGRFSASMPSVSPLVAFAVLNDGSKQSIVNAQITDKELKFSIPQDMDTPQLTELRAYSSTGLLFPWREQLQAPLTLEMEDSVVYTIAKYTKYTAVALAIAESLLLIMLFLRYRTSATTRAIIWQNPMLRKILTLGILDLLLNVPGVTRFLIKPVVQQIHKKRAAVTFYFNGINAEALLDNGSWSESKNIAEMLEKPSGYTLLTGVSGSGKSVYVKSLVHRMQSPVIMIGARQCEEGVIAAVYARLPEEASDFKIIERALATGALSIIIDGYNEGSPVARMRIQDFCLRYTTANVIITSQPGIVPELQDCKQLRITPLTMDSAEKYLTEALRHDKIQTTSLEEIRNIIHGLPANFKFGEGLTPFDLEIIKQLFKHNVAVSNENIISQFMENISLRYKGKFYRELPLTRLSELAYNERKNNSSCISESEFTTDELTFFRDERLIITGGGITGNIYAFRHERLQDWFVANFFRARQDLWKEAAAVPVMAQAFVMLIALIPRERWQMVIHVVAEVGAVTGDHTIIDRVMIHLHVMDGKYV